MKNHMMKIEFVMPEARFSAAALQVAQRVLNAIAQPEQYAAQASGTSLFASSQKKDIPAELTLAEKLERALDAQTGQAGYRDVVRYVAEAQPSRLETQLSAMRATAVVQGLQAAIRSRQPEAVPV